MFRRARFALLAAPLLLIGCADPNKKTEATPDYQYTPTTTSTGKSSTGTNPNYSSSTYSPTGTNGSSSYTSEPSTTYTPPPAYTASPGNSAGTGSSTMKVADEPVAPKSKSSTAKNSTGSSKGSSGSGHTYTVKKGDTLSEIAKQQYGDANKWQKIYNANKSRIPDPKKLQIGTKLIIP